MRLSWIACVWLAVPSKWLTPENSPTSTRAILLIVPDDPEFEAIIRGALLDLMNPENYEQHGALTPEQTADLMTPAMLTTLDWVEP
jgi:hypothetical protein